MASSVLQEKRSPSLALFNQQYRYRYRYRIAAGWHNRPSRRDPLPRTTQSPGEMAAASICHSSAQQQQQQQ
jgi:hypothetical protein